MHLWFSVTPIGTGSPSVSAEVACALDAVAATGVEVRTDPAGTIIEGEWDQVMAALKAGCEAVLSTAPRVSVVAKFDLRTDKPQQRPQDKLDSLAAARDHRLMDADG